MDAIKKNKNKIEKLAEKKISKILWKIDNFQSIKTIYMKSKNGQI